MINLETFLQLFLISNNWLVSEQRERLASMEIIQITFRAPRGSARVRRSQICFKYFRSVRSRFLPRSAPCIPVRRHTSISPKTRNLSMVTLMPGWSTFPAEICELLSVARMVSGPGLGSLLHLNCS